MTQTLQNSQVTYTDKVELNSSNLARAYYNKNMNLLFVEFHNGSLAGYREVPDSVFNGLVSAESAGRFYNRNIRGQYSGVNGDVELVPAADVVNIIYDNTERSESLRGLFANAAPWSDVTAIKSIADKPTFKMTIFVAADTLTDAVGQVVAALPEAHVYSVEQG